MNSFVPRMDILPPAQRDIWERLAPARKLGFVLYGGTEIALRLGHRQEESLRGLGMDVKTTIAGAVAGVSILPSVSKASENLGGG